MKNIIIGLSGLLILLVGIFVYVKIKDNDSIDNLNIAIENHRAGTEQLLTENTELREQLDIYESTIREAVQDNIKLGIELEESERERSELRAILERSENISTELKEIDTEFRRTITDSLSIIGELKEYDFTE